jgi:hypothetical protein
MKTNWYEIAFLVGVCLLATVGIACNGPDTPTVCANTRTKGNDEFRRWADSVSKNSNAVKDDCWRQLVGGDTVSVNSSGEAELNFSDCWDGRIFVFYDSGGIFRTERCGKALYPGSYLCVDFNTWYFGKCAGEFQVVTGSASIKKTGTSLSVTYLPEGIDRDNLPEELDLTLVVVFEGSAEITPVDTFDPTILGPTEIVAASATDGKFYFTMPLDRQSRIGALWPRRVYSVADLPPLVEELGIRDWILKVAERVVEDGVLPPTWPRDLGGKGEPPEPGWNGFGVILGGGELQNPGVAEGILMAVDWQIAHSVGAPRGGQVSAQTPDGKIIDVLTGMPYDPSEAQVLFRQAGYPSGLTVEIFFPAEDELLMKMAETLTEYLAKVNVKGTPVAVPGSDLYIKMTANMAAGVSVIALTR